MSCEWHRTVLTDLALGAPAPPALASHLAECDACRTALDTERQFVEHLDAEVEDSLHLQPSVGLLPRVRQRVAEPRGARRQWLVVWLVPATLGLLLVSRILIRKPTGTPMPPQTAATEPRPLPPAQSLPARASPRPRSLAAGRILRSERIASGPEVIIPAAEREALRRYMRDLQARRIDSVPLRMVGVEPSGLRRIEMPPIDLAPIRIAIIGVQPLTMDSPNLGVNE
jgi:hypothetical protein